jgi:hypothetical protein
MVVMRAISVVCIILFISFFFLAIIIKVVFWAEDLFGCLENASKMGQGLATDDRS